MRALVTTVAAAALVLAGGADARDLAVDRGGCGKRVLPHGATGLSATVRVETGCGTFSIERDGVRFAGGHRGRAADQRLVWRRGRLRLFAHGRLLWRSRSLYPRNAASATFALADSVLAFQYYGAPLYVADLDGPERAVGEIDEFPLGWTRAGLLVTAKNGVVRSRTRAGLLGRELFERTHAFSFEKRTRTLVYVSGAGELLRTDGRHRTPLTDLSAFRLGRWPAIEPLPSGRIAVVGRRLVVLDRRGRLIASDRPRWPTAGASGESSKGVVATLVRRYSPGYAGVRESIRLLQPGARSSLLLFTHELRRRECAHSTTLSWRGDSLLYATTEGHVIATHTRSGKRVDLTAVVKRLPGEFVSAAWA